MNACSFLKWVKDVVLIEITQKNESFEGEQWHWIWWPCITANLTPPTFSLSRHTVSQNDLKQSRDSADRRCNSVAPTVGWKLKKNKNKWKTFCSWTNELLPEQMVRVSELQIHSRFIQIINIRKVIMLLYCFYLKWTWKRSSMLLDYCSL